MNETTHPTFPHTRLQVYWLALQLAAEARKLAALIPRGHRSVADHMLRAAAGVVLLLAAPAPSAPAPADRRGAGEKRQRFVESRAETGEVAAAADLAVALSLVTPAQAARVLQLADRVAAMLTRLFQRCC